MGECKTVEFLKKIVEADGDMAMVARSALGIVSTLRDSDGLNPIAIVYLQELVEHIYQESSEPLLSHLREGADCDICAALAARIDP